MNSSKVLAIMPVYGRAETLSLVIPHYNALGINIMFVGEIPNVGSFPYNNIRKIIYPTSNDFPFKINKALHHAKTYEYDYFFMIGCDDIISEKLFDCMLDMMINYNIDLVALRSIYFYDRINNVSALWPGYPSTSVRKREPAGAFRLYHRSLLDRMGWTLYDGGFSMDYSSWNKSLKHTDKYAIITPNQVMYAIDIKDHQSLTHLDDFDYLEAVTETQHRDIRELVYRYAAEPAQHAEGEGGHDL